MENLIALRGVLDRTKLSPEPSGSPCSNSKYSTNVARQESNLQNSNDCVPVASNPYAEMSPLECTLALAEVFYKLDPIDLKKGEVIKRHQRKRMIKQLLYSREQLPPTNPQLFKLHVQEALVEARAHQEREATSISKDASNRPVSSATISHPPGSVQHYLTTTPLDLNDSFANTFAEKTRTVFPLIKQHV
ncbi:hypothetical protein GCK72_024290 [Caenorhabditis remanei]|uniref:Uncharacterized protein n=1 Tax=Caenorhabditis remanei TaxID=31234 RepID=A0A6A5FZG7_CAERE|nr:hypothetical protein GCK72_024290 [Caenorhabditis remanei]KAF1747824.1 hypothetical protein GCK72_024290 [Caenorhabditis remanei]